MSESESESIKVGDVTEAGAWLWLPLGTLLDAQQAMRVVEDLRTLGTVIDPEWLVTHSPSVVAALIDAIDEALASSLAERMGVDKELRGELLQVIEEKAIQRRDDPEWGQMYAELAAAVVEMDMAEEEAPPPPPPPLTPLEMFNQILASLGSGYRAPAAKRSGFDRLIELKGEVLKRAGRDPARLHIAGTIQRRRVLYSVARYLRDLERDPERAAEWEVASELMEGLWHLLD